MHRATPLCTPAALQFSHQNTNTGRRCGSSAEALRKRCGNGADPASGKAQKKSSRHLGAVRKRYWEPSGIVIFQVVGPGLEPLAERVRMRVRNGSGYALGRSLSFRFHGSAPGSGPGGVRNFKSRDGAEPVRNRLLGAVPHPLQ